MRLALACLSTMLCIALGAGRQVEANDSASDRLFLELPVTATGFRLIEEKGPEARARTISEMRQFAHPLAKLAVLQLLVELCERGGTRIADTDIPANDVRERAGAAIRGILSLTPAANDAQLILAVAGYERGLLDQAGATREATAESVKLDVSQPIELRDFLAFLGQWPPLGAPAKELAQRVGVDAGDEQQLESILVIVTIGNRSRRCRFVVKSGTVTGILVDYND